MAVITAPKLFDGHLSDRTTRNSGGPHRTLRICKQVFRYAVATGRDLRLLATRIPQPPKRECELSFGGALCPHHDLRPITITRHATSYEMFEQCRSGNLERLIVRQAFTVGFAGFATVNNC